MVIGQLAGFEQQYQRLVVVQFRSGDYAQDIMRCYVSIAINKSKLRLTWKGLTRDKISSPKPAQKVPGAKSGQTKPGIAGKAASAVKTENAQQAQTVFQIPVRDSSRMDKADSRGARESRELRDVMHTSGDEQPSDAKRPRLESYPFTDSSPATADTFPGYGNKPAGMPGRQGDGSVEATGDGASDMNTAGQLISSSGDTRSVEIVSRQETSGRKFKGQIVQGTEAISDDEDIQGMEAISPEWDDDSPDQQTRAKNAQRPGRGVQRNILDSRQSDRNTVGFDRNSSGRYEKELQMADKDRSKDRFRGPSDREAASSNRRPAASLDLMSLRKEAAKHLASLEKNLHATDAKRPESVGNTRGTGDMPSTSFSMDYGHQQRTPDILSGSRPRTDNPGNQGMGFGMMSSGRNLQSGSMVRPGWEPDAGISQQRGVMGPAPSQMGMENFNVVIFSESTNSRGTKLGMLID
nr:hypothetical protein BaRGS_006648 [Batillaria attramentaria]